MKITGAWLTIWAVTGAINVTSANLEKDYPIKPVSFANVNITDSFWSQRLETNSKVTIPYAFQKCEETGRIDNFLRAAGEMEGEFAGEYPFNDSDPFKIIEGAAYSLSVHPDPELDRYLDDLIDKIASAQEKDGYLYTARTIDRGKPVRWVEKKRWSNLRMSHELYNAGHLYEAAAAHYLATGKKTLLNVALKNADLICRVFGPDQIRDVPGHQVIEIGLVKLYRITGEEKYLNLSRFFLDERGHAHDRELYGSYSQDHKPVIEQSEAVGHAVRATYMYSGMADIAALYGDGGYLAAIDRIWENIVSKKLYLTGGIGARHGGESFGDNYELPNMTAYNETCAAIGNAMWNHRMFLLHGDAKYIDVLERILYNGVLSGISLNGDRFFYPNPLAAGAGGKKRSPWFACACCPSNLARFIPSIPGYLYAYNDDVLYINLFAGSETKIQMGDNTVGIEQKTRYPWNGKVKIAVAPERSHEFSIHIRIPGWARNLPVPGDLYRYLRTKKNLIRLKVNGRRVRLDLEKGYTRIRRTWKKGDVVELNIPMPVRRVQAHDNVKDDAGRIALERGPIVYCMEWTDNDGHVFDWILPENIMLKTIYRADLFNGIKVITGKAITLSFRQDGKTVKRKKSEFTAIPYYAWAHRGKGEMAVWLAHDTVAARPMPYPTIVSSAALSYSFMRKEGESQLSEKALNDRIVPERSNDQSILRFHWWPHTGSSEWVQYDFQKTENFSSASVYWFDDTGRGGCRTPASWRLLYKDGNEWKPVKNNCEYGVKTDKFNQVTFSPVETKRMRLEVKLKPKQSGGILEWRLE